MIHDEASVASASSAVSLAVPSSWTGRSEEARWLGNALRNRRRVALRGAPGSGRHALLQRALDIERSAATLHGGIVVIDAAAERPLMTVAATRILGLDAVEDERTALRTLARANVLLVIEAALPPAALIEALAQPAGVLGAEVVWIVEEVPEGFADDVVEVTGLPLHDGSQGAPELVRRRAALAGVSIAETDVRRLARGVSGNPLAIGILVGCMASRGADEVLTWLANRRPAATAVDALTFASGTAADERLVGLVAFPGSFSLGGAATVAELGSDDLARLVAHGWLDEAGPGRWHMPTAARAFLRARWPHGKVAAANRYLTYVQGELERADRVGFATFALTDDDVDAAWRRLVRERRWRALVDLAAATIPWARRGGRGPHAVHWIRTARDAAVRESAPGDVQARIGYRLALAETEVGAGDEAERHIHEIRSDEALPADVRSEGLRHLGNVLMLDARYPEAAAVYADALAVDDQADRILTSMLMANLAQARLLAGEAEGSEAPLRRAIEIKRAEGRPAAALPDLNALGLALLATSRAHEAVPILRDGARLAGRLGDETMRPYLCHTLALALLEVGAQEQAYEAALEALEATSPPLHDTLVLLVDITIFRIQIRSIGTAAAGSPARDAVSAALASGGQGAWYAVLAVAEHLADAQGDRISARVAYDALAKAPMEAHFRAAIAASAARHALPTEDGVAPPHMIMEDAETPSALIARLAPQFIVG
jgi:tetratricopeptide (TPR) repeat protein